MKEEIKKTGMTPIIDQEGSVKGKIHNVLPVTTALIKYTDGNSKEDVRLAIIIPGGAVHLIHQNSSGSIDLRPVQKWMTEAIHKHLKDVGVEATPVYFKTGKPHQV